MPEITLHQQVFAFVTALVIFAFIVELVRRRRLREEYSWLWLLTGAAMLVMVVWYRALLFVTAVIGAMSPVTTLMLFSLLFLLAIAIHYSIIVSRLTVQVKNLAQELALLAAERERGTTADHRAR
jgi:Uncharacterized conserved protein (DUF2304)